MAPTLFSPEMISDVAKPPPDTPTVTQSPLWEFRQPFDPKSWPSGLAPVNCLFLYCSDVNSNRFN